MKYGSVCSGVEAATVAWHPLGWEPQWFSEIEKFPSAVLQHHYPDTPNHGDMTQFKEWPDDRSNGVELIVGGPPCQDFSIAGQRRGMSVAGNEGGERANLTLKYLDLVAHFRPRWICYENVPGLLSSNRGRDFGAFLGALAELGYGFSWRTLDAQFFGVPQRRRRVFVVGCAGDWRRAAAVLFERHSLQGHSAPSRKAREETAGTVTRRAGNGGGGGLGTDKACSGYLQPTWPAEIASTLNAAFGDKQGLEDQHINSGAPLFVPDSVGPLTAGMHKGPRGTEAVESNHVIAFPAGMSGTQAASAQNISPTLSVTHETAVCAPLNTQLGLRGADTSNSSREGLGIGNDGDPSFTLQAAHSHAIISPLAVRRLTPIECERLQGFGDNYTQIPWRNKPAENCPDGPRYKAMGNSMAVPVMRWIGSRIKMVDKL